MATAAMVATSSVATARRCKCAHKARGKGARTEEEEAHGPQVALHELDERGGRVNVSSVKQEGEQREEALRSLEASAHGHAPRPGVRAMTSANTRATWSAPGRSGWRSAAAAVTPVSAKLKSTVATASHNSDGGAMAGAGEPSQGWQLRARQGVPARSVKRRQTWTRPACSVERALTLRHALPEGAARRKTTAVVRRPTRLAPQ